MAETKKKAPKVVDGEAVVETAKKEKDNKELDAAKAEIAKLNADVANAVAEVENTRKAARTHVIVSAICSAVVCAIAILLVCLAGWEVGTGHSYKFNFIVKDLDLLSWTTWASVIAAVVAVGSVVYSLIFYVKKLIRK